MNNKIENLKESQSSNTSIETFVVGWKAPVIFFLFIIFAGLSFFLTNGFFENTIRIWLTFAILTVGLIWFIVPIFKKFKKGFIIVCGILAEIFFLCVALYLQITARVDTTAKPIVVYRDTVIKDTVRVPLAIANKRPSLIFYDGHIIGNKIGSPFSVTGFIQNTGDAIASRVVFQLSTIITTDPNLKAFRVEGEYIGGSIGILEKRSFNLSIKSSVLSQGLIDSIGNEKLFVYLVGRIIYFDEKGKEYRPLEIFEMFDRNFSLFKEITNYTLTYGKSSAPQNIKVE